MRKYWFFRIFICSLIFYVSGIQATSLSHETVYLTWQRSPSTTMTIQWISAVNEKNCAIFYREKKGNGPWKKVVGKSIVFPKMPQHLLHSVELQGLLPSTEYFFSFIPDQKQYQFVTAPSLLTKDFRFVVGGDLYHDEIEWMEKTSLEAAATSPLFAVLGGDIAYSVASRYFTTEKTERWLDWVKSWHKTMVTPEGNLIPVIAAIGNHDIVGQYDQTPEQAIIFSSLFPMPGPQIYNLLDFGDFLTLWLLDSGHGNPVGEKQSIWLEKTLKERQSTMHRIAVYHVPAYPSARSYNNNISQEIRQFWVPLFEKFGVQTVFEHHDHMYKRTYPLLKNRVNKEGVVYLGDGGWGVAKPRKLRSKKNYVEKYGSMRHFILVVLSTEERCMQAISDGKIVDECRHPVK
jgi:acid phosphatase type 7